MKKFQQALLFAVLMILLPAGLFAQAEVVRIPPLLPVTTYPGSYKGKELMRMDLGYYNIGGSNTNVNGGLFNLNVRLSPSKKRSVVIGLGLAYGRGSAPLTPASSNYSVATTYGSYTTTAIPDGKSMLSSFYCDFNVGYTVQLLRLNRFTLIGLVGARIVQCGGASYKSPRLYNSGGRLVGDTLKIGTFLAQTPYAYYGIQIGLPLGKFKVAPFLLFNTWSGNVTSTGADAGGPGQTITQVGVEFFAVPGRKAFGLSYSSIPANSFHQAYSVMNVTYSFFTKK